MRTLDMIQALSMTKEISEGDWLTFVRMKYLFGRDVLGILGTD